MGKSSTYSDLSLKYKLESELLEDKNFTVTSDGRVYNLHCKDIRYLTGNPRRYAIRYKSIALNLYVERLVYRKFIRFSIPLYCTVVHKDGNILNNSADNLSLMQNENTPINIDNMLDDDIRWIREYGVWDDCASRLCDSFNLTVGQIKDIVTGVIRPEVGGLIISPEEFDKIVYRTIRKH